MSRQAVEQLKLQVDIIDRKYDRKIYKSNTSTLKTNTTASKSTKIKMKEGIIWDLSKDNIFFIPFEELNLQHIKQKYGFKIIKLIHDVLYISTKYDDEYYIDKKYILQIDDYTCELFHKNKRHDTRKYHNEEKYFKNIFHLFSYIKRHDNKPFDNKKTAQIRRMERMKELFAMI